MAVSYPADGNAVCFQLEDGSFWFRHRNRCITAAVEQFPPAGAILDIGGGNGFVARALIDAGYSATLLEPGEEGAWNARTHRKIPDVIHATLEDAGLATGSVTAAGLFDVLEHIDDDRGFVERLRELMAPGGVVYVTVPAHQWLWSVTDVDAGHFRRYSTAQLRERFTRAGFDVLYATYFFEALLVPFYLMRTLPYALGLSKARAASDYQTEHAAGGGLLSTILEKLLAREVSVITRRRTLVTGTSCLLVARKAASRP
jgi:SAM-dependent methyltransferase